MKAVFGGKALAVKLSESANIRMLALQQQVQAQAREYATISNIMKAKHDTQKNAIGNMR